METKYDAALHGMESKLQRLEARVEQLEVAGTATVGSWLEQLPVPGRNNH